MFHALLAAACAAQSGHLVCTATSNAGKSLTLTFATAAVAADPSTAFSATLCASPAAQATEAKLWMSEHGHGSARTRLAASGNCTAVSRLVFTMSGDWEVQVTLADADKGVIHVAVP